MNKLKNVLNIICDLWNLFITFIYISFQILIKNTIGISAPYFDEEKLKDGYYRRIKAIDGLMSDKLKIYFSSRDKIRFPFMEKPNHLTIVFYYNELIPLNNMIRDILVFFIRKIYCHSVYQVKWEYFKIPYLKIYLDVHGIVPEEEHFRGNYEISAKMNEIEEITIKKAEHIFVVTEAMAQFLISKYGEFVKNKYTVLPIYDTNLSDISASIKKLPDNKCTTIYAGGCAKWQKIELIQEIIYKTSFNVNYIICVPDTSEFWKTWKYDQKPENLNVESKTYKELCEDVYPDAQYGFVLRDDIAVNNVACPTKISEYLEHDIIPVVLSPDIGDFKNMGMVYITVDEFVKGNLFSKEQYEKAVLKNRELLIKYNKLYEKGKVRFKEILL